MKMSELGGKGRGRRRNKPAESRFVTIMSFMGSLLVLYQLHHDIIRTIKLSFTMFYMIIYICVIHERWSLQCIER